MRGRALISSLLESYQRGLLVVFLVLLLLLCFLWKTPPTNSSFTSSPPLSIASHWHHQTKLHHDTNNIIFKRTSLVDAIHVVLPFDVGEYNRGMKALIGSIVNNTVESHRLFFHFIAEPSKALAASRFVSELQLYLPKGALCDLSIFYYWESVKHLYSSSFSIGEVDRSNREIENGKNTTSNLSISGTRFGNPLNVARIYLELLFPSLEKVISLDTDQIVLGDIAELNSIDLSKLPIASTRSEKAQPLSFYLNERHTKLKELVDRGELDLSERVIGGGLFVANLTTWRKESLASKIEIWCRIHSEEPLLAQKTLKKTLLNLVFNRRVLILDDSWNSGDCTTTSELFRSSPPTQNTPSNTQRTDYGLSVKILHFAGFNGKPWDSLSVCSVVIKNLWNSYFAFFESFKH